MEGEVGRRHQPEPQLAGVQRDRHVRCEEADDLHLARIIAPGHQRVFRADVIERHDQRFRANERRGNGGANENVVQRIVAQDLRDETKGDRARRLWTL